MAHTNHTFSDVNMMTSESPDNDITKKSGCFISKCCGICILFVVILTSIGAGLIAHFVTKSTCDELPGSWEDINEFCTREASQREQCFQMDGCASMDGDVTTETPPVSYNARLPDGVIPEHYDLEVRPNIYQPLNHGDFYMDGNVKMLLLCQNSTRLLKFNALNLEIKLEDIKLESSQGDSPSVTDMEYDDDLQIVTLTLSDQMTAGNYYNLSILYYKTQLAVDYEGAYLSYYKDAANNTHYMVVTQLEAAHARKAFPCFDEPALKATFTITVVHKKPMDAWSNGIKTETTLRSDGWNATTFATTPKMPTYLVAFMVSEYECVDAVTTTTSQVRICTRPEAIPQTEYAREVAGVIQEWLEDYTGIPFELTKNDHVSVPHFQSGAMENWGLINYRERYLLYAENDTSTRDKFFIASIVAHELAHMDRDGNVFDKFNAPKRLQDSKLSVELKWHTNEQWFGNIVTCAFWNDLFVNEALASYFEQYAYQRAEPNWDPEQSLLRENMIMWERDGRVTVEAMSLDMTNQLPKNYDNVFNFPVYYKGPHIVRMMAKILGENTMQRGLRDYLGKYNHSSATVENLLEVLSEAAAVDDVTDSDGTALDMVDKFIPYIKQAGLPLVTVTKQNDQLIFSQKRFLNSDADEVTTPSPYNYKWDIPLSVYTTSGGESSFTWFSKNQNEARITTSHSDPWYLINYRRNSWYRVHYEDASQRTALVNQLNSDHTVIHEYNRAQLIDDIFALYGANTYGITEKEVFEWIHYMDSEEDYLPWQAAIEHLFWWDLYFQETSNNGIYQGYMQRQLNTVYTRIGWDEVPNEPLNDKFLRRLIIREACWYGNEHCVKEADERFENWLKRDTWVHTDLLPYVLCTGLKRSFASEWDQLYMRYTATDEAIFKDIYIYGLTCSPEYWILHRMLEWSLDESQLLYEERNNVAYYLAGRSQGRILLWNHLRQHWNNTLLGTYKRTILMRVTNWFKTDNHLKELDDLHEEYAEDEDKNSFDQAYENINSNRQWMAEHYQPLSDWLISASTTSD